MSLLCCFNFSKNSVFKSFLFILLSMEGTFCWDCKFQQNIKEDIKDPKTLRDVGLDYNTTRTKGLMMQKPTGKSCENKDILLYAMKPFQIIASCQRTTLVSL
ncbi:hypothetical protein GDO81_015760 [Engystomops pustulosus]|uniref:Uncharacterized protein n=1 Tax=Engystomops pustulosus TaxID=76066 RepID=A0AAV7ARM5_ENGPU|nr:hypothetical protein GDO81_015760 [Engystomops pustulosus]